MPVSITENRCCLDAMREFPDRFFELAIVDPPYGTKQIKNNLHGRISWNEDIPTESYFNELSRISKNQIIWGENYFSQYLKGGGRIVWNKLLTPIYQKTFSHCEIAYCSLQNRITIFNYQWSGNVQDGIMNTVNLGLDRRIHPTQKPVALYKWLLINYAKQGDKILDTHLGSQSSRIAAYDLGFDFWGYELDTDYFSDGEKRFAEHIAQPKLFEPIFAKTEQVNLF